MAMKPCKECKTQVSTSAKVCPNCGKKHPTGGLTLPVKIGLGVLGLIIVGQVVTQIQKGDIGTTPTPKYAALQNTKVDMSWEKGGFGSVMLATVTVRNNSDYPVKDIQIQCTHYAKSGTQIDSNTRTIFDVIPAKSTKVFPKFNMGLIHSQVESSACTLVDLQVAQ